jgi:hypothetical protein
MAGSQPELHRPRPNKKEGFSYAGKCKVTMNYDCIDIQTKVLTMVMGDYFNAYTWRIF